MHSPRWTDEMKNDLRQAVKEGLGVSESAFRLRKTYCAVNHQAQKMGLKFKQRKGHSKTSMDRVDVKYLDERIQLMREYKRGLAESGYIEKLRHEHFAEYDERCAELEQRMLA